MKEADIILDGITVIAGKNNTGKSTVGKVLDSMYNSTSNLEAKMKRARKSRLQNSLKNIINYAGVPVPVSPAVIIDIVERIFEVEGKEDEIWELKRLSDFVYSKDSEMESKMLLEELLDEVEKIKKIPDEVFTKAILINYFSEMFNGNINNIEHADTVAKVEIEIKRKVKPELISAHCPQV